MWNWTLWNSQKKTGRSLFDMNCSNIFFSPSPRIMEIKTKTNGTYLNSKAFAQPRKQSRKWKANPQTGRKYLQMMYPKGDLSPNFTNSSWHLTASKQTIHSKNGQKTWIDISPKKRYRWPVVTWKDVQHCYLLEKCKSNEISPHTS